MWFPLQFIASYKIFKGGRIRKIYIYIYIEREREREREALSMSCILLSVSVLQNMDHKLGQFHPYCICNVLRKNINDTNTSQFVSK
jgi:hypothetical protein